MSGQPSQDTADLAQGGCVARACDLLQQIQYLQRGGAGGVPGLIPCPGWPRAAASMGPATTITMAGGNAMFGGPGTMTTPGQSHGQPRQSCAAAYLEHVQRRAVARLEEEVQHIVPLRRRVIHEQARRRAPAGEAAHAVEGLAERARVQGEGRRGGAPQQSEGE